MTIGAIIKPAMKATRQTLSPAEIAKVPPRMPLIPAMRPISNISSTDASPINPPPRNADTGSNGAIDYPLAQETNRAGSNIGSAAGDNNRSADSNRGPLRDTSLFLRNQHVRFTLGSEP